MHQLATQRRDEIGAVFALDECHHQIETRGPAATGKTLTIEAIAGIAQFQRRELLHERRGALPVQRYLEAVQQPGASQDERPRLQRRQQSAVGRDLT